MIKNHISTYRYSFFHPFGGYLPHLFGNFIFSLQTVDSFRHFTLQLQKDAPLYSLRCLTQSHLRVSNLENASISELGILFRLLQQFKLCKSERKRQPFKICCSYFVFAFQSSAVIFCLLAICECVPPYGGGGSDYGGGSYGGSHDEDYHHQEVIKSELILCNDFKIKRSHC